MDWSLPRVDDSKYGRGDVLVNGGAAGLDELPLVLTELMTSS